MEVGTEKIIVLLTDANIVQYELPFEEMNRIIQQASSSRIKLFVIFIASIEDQKERYELIRELP